MSRLPSLSRVLVVAFCLCFGDAHRTWNSALRAGRCATRGGGDGGQLPGAASDASLEPSGATPQQTPQQPAHLQQSDARARPPVAPPPPPPPPPPAPPLEPVPLPFDARGLEIRRAILEAETGDRLLREAENIQAIRGNFDGALRITRATLDDARLACLAIYRLAALAAAPPPPRQRRPPHKSSHSLSHDDSAIDREDIVAAACEAEEERQRALACAGDPRFGQLLEVVQCQLAELELSDLSKVVWGLAMLNQRREGLLDRLAGLAAERAAAVPALVLPAAPTPAPDDAAGERAAEASPNAGKDADAEAAGAPEEDMGSAADKAVSGAARDAEGSFISEAQGERADGGVAAFDTAQDESLPGAAEGIAASSIDAALLPQEGGDEGGAAGEERDNLLPQAIDAANGERGEGVEEKTKERETERQRLEESRNQEEQALQNLHVEQQRFAQRQQLLAVELATAAVAFGHARARLGFAAPAIFEALVAPLAPRVEFLPARELSSVAWAYGTVRHRAEPLLSAVATQVLSLPPRALSGREIAGLCWAFATLRQRPPGLFDRLAIECLPAVPAMAEHDVAHMAWGLAKAGLPLPGEEETPERRRRPAFWTTGQQQQPPPPLPPLPGTAAVAGGELLRAPAVGEAAPAAAAAAATAGASEVREAVGAALLLRAEERFAFFKPKHLSRLVWALATWHEQGVQILGAAALTARAMAEAGRGSRELWTPDDLAQVVWAFATLVGNDDSPTQDLAVCLGRMAALFESEVAAFDPPTLCDVLWAMAAVRHPAHALAEAVGEVLVDRVQDLPLPSIASLAWAHARIGHPAAELMDRVLGVVEHRLGDFSARDAAAVMWALGALGHTVSLKRPLLLEPAALRELNPSAVANLLWGLARTGAAASPAFDREALAMLAADMGPKLLSCSHHELCRLMWALAQLRYPGDPSAAGSPHGAADEIPNSESNPDAPEPSMTAAMDDAELGDASGAAAAMAAAAGASASAAAMATAATTLADRVVVECCKWVEVFSAQELADVLWALCRLRRRGGALVPAIEKDLRRRRDALPGLARAAAAAAAAGGSAAAAGGATTRARAAAFELGRCEHWLEEYERLDFDGTRAASRYQAGKRLLSRMFQDGQGL